jgi:hypothetical protein
MDEPDFKNPCTDMTFSYDGTRFIVTSTDQTAKLYDAYVYPPPPPSLLCSCVGSVPVLHQNNPFSLFSSATYCRYSFEILTTVKSDRPLHSASISPDCGDKASHNEFLVCGGGVEASKAATTGGQGKFEAVFYHQVYGCHVGGEQVPSQPPNSKPSTPNEICS